MTPELRLETLGGLHLKLDGAPLEGAAGQRRSLALLVVIAAARDRGVSRDTLAAMLWAESDEERARRALAQALYRIRQELGADLVIGTDRLRLSPKRLSVDLLEFDAAIDRGEPENAVTVHRGPFLHGFLLPGAPQFEEWADGERSRVATRYRQALTELATTATRSARFDDAARWWRALLATDPLNARVVVPLMHALDASGDPAGALQAARVYEALVRQELDMPPDRSVTEAIAAVRDRPAPARRIVVPHSSPAAVHAPADSAAPTGGSMETAAAGVASTEPAPEPALITPGSAISERDVRTESRRDDRLTFRRWLLAAGVVFFVAGVGAALVALRTRNAPAPLRIAVGAITDFTGSDTLSVARALPELLTTGLGQYHPLDLVSRARLYEVASQLGAEPEAAELARAARQEGADVLVDGALFRRPSESFRLDLRVLDLERGIVRHVYQLEGTDAFALADSASALVAADIGVRRTAPTQRITGVTTRSLAALQLYEQGLRAFYYGDGPSAEHFFAAALREDSSFAMAAYFAYRTAFGHNERAPDYLALAVRGAPRASDRERLIILATAAAADFNPARVALADTLAARFPTEAVSHVLLGYALTESRGDFAGARVAFRQAFAMDSAGLRDGVTRCSVCDAMHGLIFTELLADSLANAEREARKWTQLQPSSAHAWLTLATVLTRRGDSSGAREAFRRRASIVPYSPDEFPFSVTLALRVGDFARAAAIASDAAASVDPGIRRSGLWWLIITHRYEGRISDAMAAARLLISDWPADPTPLMAYAQVLAEAGRTDEALAQFDAIADQLQAPSLAAESVKARRATWAMTHLATALAATGDTARLATLIEPMRRSGERSGYARDRLLHHYARGMLLAARGHHAGAISELRLAMFSPAEGYTRVNLELGRLLLESNQPAAAVAVLRSALHGPLEASNLYVTHTELHALLARAFGAMRANDSAAVHREYVQQALARADADGRARFTALLGSSSGTRHTEDAPGRLAGLE